MSNKSRRRVTLARRKTRRGLTIAAFLAGATIPLAAAGNAWADTDETLGQLLSQGVPFSEATAIVQAEHNGTPVEVSINDKTVVEANEGSSAANQANAYSGTSSDQAVAIGNGADAYAGTTGSGTPVAGDTHDAAFADGTYASAGAGSYGNFGSSTTTGSYDTATDIGNNSAGQPDPYNPGGASGATALGNHSSAYDQGNNTGGYANGAFADGNNDHASDVGNNVGSYNGAQAGNGTNNDVATYTGNATNNDTTGAGGTGACSDGCGANATGTNDSVNIFGNNDNTNVSGNSDSVTVLGSNANGSNGAIYGITDTGNHDFVIGGSGAEGDITGSGHFVFLP